MPVCYRNFQNNTFRVLIISQVDFIVHIMCIFSGPPHEMTGCQSLKKKDARIDKHNYPRHQLCNEETLQINRTYSFGSSNFGDTWYGFHYDLRLGGLDGRFDGPHHGCICS